MASVGVVSGGLGHLVESLHADGDLLVAGLVLGPAALVPMVFRRSEPPRIYVAVACFWSTTALLYGLAAIRSGSGPYYFLEPASYGLLICLSGTAHRPDAAGTPVAHATYGLLFLALLAIPKAARASRVPTYVPPAIRQTLAVGTDRVALAARINEADHYCYSDDPGLNVLLDRPAVIYPMLPQQMIAAGRLPPGILTDPIRRHDFDCVVLSGLSWEYRGLEIPPPEFVELVESEYPREETFGAYRVRLP
jgi:hypothetical protein